MADKVIIRSATIDRHGDYTSVEMLEDYVNVVNGPQKMRYLANHRRDLPPIGYFDEAEIQYTDGICHVRVLPVEFEEELPVSWDETLLMARTKTGVSFLSNNDSADLKQIRVEVDKNNFDYEEDLSETGRLINDTFDGDVSLRLDMRKELYPDPRIVITLAPYAAILYPLVKPLLKKMGEKFAEDVADDLYKSCKARFKSLIKKLSTTVRVTREKMVPAQKVLLTIIQIPGDTYIELHIRSDSSIKIEKGLQPRNLASVHEKIQHFQQFFDVTEIFFVLNDKNKWEFSYLLTKDGNAIGTKSTFKKRNKLIQRINLSPTKAFSIGASGVTYERLPIAPSDDK